MSANREKYSISQIYGEYNRAYKNKDWVTLNQATRDLLSLLRIDAKSHPEELQLAARYYLASIMSNGKFLLGRGGQELEFFESGVSRLKVFLKNSSEKVRTILTPQIKAIHEIRLFLTSPNADSQNKAATALRKIARPDLTIELTSEQLTRTRLNYYSLTSRGWAYLDLGRVEEAIADGELALKHSPRDKIGRTHALLGSAYRRDFKRSGDLEVGELAVTHASKAYALGENFFNARILLSAYHAIGQSIPDDLAIKLAAFKLPAEDTPSLDALEIAANITLQSLEELSIPVEEETELDVDDWIEEVDENDNTESQSDYFNDYFEDFAESLSDPQRPHLEP